MNTFTKSWIGLGLLLFFFDAQANSVICSSYDQNLLYQESQYSGGPAPLPGQEIARRKIEIKNKITQEIVYYQDKPAQGEWNVQLDFTDLYIIKEVDTGNSGSRDYVSKLAILNSHGTSLGEFFVICKKDWMYAP